MHNTIRRTTTTTTKQASSKYQRHDNRKCYKRLRFQRCEHGIMIQNTQFIINMALRLIPRSTSTVQGYSNPILLIDVAQKLCISDPLLA